MTIFATRSLWAQRHTKTAPHNLSRAPSCGKLWKKLSLIKIVFLNAIKPKIAMSITTFLLFGLLTKLEYDEFKIFFESYLLLLLGNFSARYQRLYSRGAI